MKTYAALFASSALFGLAISIVYWFSAHDRGTTLLLGFMTIALTWAAGFSLIGERKANLSGDDPNLQHKEVAGEQVTLVTKESPWPICLAFSILWLFIGVIWSDFMIFSGIVAILLCLWRLGGESARV